jgi:hypothetical protein
LLDEDVHQQPGGHADDQEVAQQDTQADLHALGCRL